MCVGGWVGGGAEKEQSETNMTYTIISKQERSIFIVVVLLVLFRLSV